MTETEPAGTPLGAVLISILTGLYGAMWIVAAMLASPRANAWAAFGPFIGLAFVAVAVGLWLRNSVAWALTVALYACGSVWTIITEVMAGATDRLTAVFVGFVAVIYLLARRDRFGGAPSAAAEDAQ